VPVRENEPIPTGPDWILRIEMHHAVPDRVDQRRKRHRCARMPGLGLPDCIDGKRANCIDTQLIDFGLSDWFSYVRRAHVLFPSIVIRRPRRQSPRLVRDKCDPRESTHRHRAAD
jgi:hypothetical protein